MQHFNLPSHHFLLRLSSAKLLSRKSDVLVLFASTSLMMPRKLSFFSLVLSRIDHYTSLLAGVLQSLVCKLQKVQNSTDCFVVCAPSHAHATSILSHLHWLPVTTRSFFKITCLCFTAIISSTPIYLSDLLHSVLSFSISSLQCPHRCLPRISLAVSVTAVLKVAITESMSEPLGHSP